MKNLFMLTCRGCLGRFFLKKRTGDSILRTSKKNMINVGLITTEKLDSVTKLLNRSVELS